MAVAVSSMTSTGEDNKSDSDKIWICPNCGRHVSDEEIDNAYNVDGMGDSEPNRRHLSTCCGVRMTRRSVEVK